VSFQPVLDGFLKPAPCIADWIQLDAALVPANVVTTPARGKASTLGPRNWLPVLESPGAWRRCTRAIESYQRHKLDPRLIGLERPLFELILDVIPADRQAIVLVEDTGGLLPGVLAWDKAKGRLLCAFVTDEWIESWRELAIFSNEVHDAGGASRSAMAAPLIASIAHLDSSIWKAQRRAFARRGTPPHAGDYPALRCNRAERTRATASAG